MARPHRGADARLGSMSASPTSTSSLPAGTPPGPMAWAVVASAPFARRSWRELLYALMAFPLGLAGFVFVVASLFIGIYLSIALVGVALLALSSLGARQLGALNRALARRFLDEEVAPPPPFRPRPGVVGWVRSGLADRPGWRARAYLVLKLPVALASFIAVMALRLGSLWLVLAPAQWAANVGAETVQDDGVARHYVINFGSFYFDTWPRTLLLTAIGLAGWWLAPWVLRALLYLDRRLLADLLGPSSLPSRVRQLERARAGAVDDATARLRRLERDLHDGAQAELVGLAIKLGLAQEKLAQAEQHSPPEVAHARKLVEAAHASAKAALRELRDLARGMHPPELEEGLGAALGALAARSPLPAQTTVTLTARPSPAIEVIVYFCAAELLTNAAKHSGGSAVSLQLAQERDLLRLTVADDGVGGAQMTGGGLSGLAERLATIDGRLDVTSPPGGPTVASVELPVRP
jgi:signal transduction histidine kinase